ncbi:MAG: hypothetical protein AAB389_04735 [Patescibacteria group bacterium]
MEEKLGMVGLIAFTRLPKDGLVALLQRRGEFNDKTMSDETMPGVCQTTVWGNQEKGETLESALYREIAEEVDLSWSLHFHMDLLENSSKTCVIECADGADGNPPRLVIAWMVPPKKIESIRFHPATGGLKRITEDKLDSIKNAKSFDKMQGVTDLTIIAMFPDSKAALIKAFEWAKSQPNPES